MKYRKRETVDAVQWFKPGYSEPQVRVYREHFDGIYYEPAVFLVGNWCGPVVTPGDWIITHADGTHSVCKAEDFEREYELAPGIHGNGLLTPEEFNEIAERHG